jgi:biotin-dependent carboxylase-like uncharacterized protein
MPIEVVKPGLSTTIQDRGREGYYHVGVPPSGALDQFSLVAANRLVGNDDGAAVLECAYMGPELVFGEAAVVAATGAELEPRVDGEPQPRWTAFEVPAGATLTFGHLKGGARLYLAVAGGVDVPETLGSRSTYALGAMGGLEGRQLEEGDTLAIGRANGARPGGSVPERLWPTFAMELEIRVVMGLYDHLLTEEGRRTFEEATWTLTPVADRVGFRYKGPKLEMLEREQPFGAGSDPSNIVDAPYPIGSIQVPGGVEPICLLNDAVTGGGYVTIGTVISVDRDVLAQSKTHGKTRFRAVGIEEALQARAERKARLDAVRAALS